MTKNELNINEITAMNWIEITDREFRLLSNYVYDKIGISLNDQKRNLLMSRLQKILRSKKMKSFEEYYDFLTGDRSGEALSDLANYISTNHTFFYRENEHFEFFTTIVLPETLHRNKKFKTNDIRIWSAGCSSGEEPYFLVMLMMEFLGLDYDNYDAGILATDISEKALSIARKGIYSDDKIKTLPDIYKKKYFNKNNDGDWEIKANVKKEVTYRRFNLINENFPFRKQFDCIFCRNVMIYFDDTTRENLVKKFYDLTLPGGYLFIGHSESISRSKTAFKYIKPAVYQKI